MHTTTLLIPMAKSRCECPCRTLAEQSSKFGPEAVLLELVQQVFSRVEPEQDPRLGALLSAPAAPEASAGQRPHLSEEGKRKLVPLAEKLSAALKQRQLKLSGNEMRAEESLLLGLPLWYFLVQLLLRPARWVQGIRRANAAQFSADKMQEWFAKNGH